MRKNIALIIGQLSLGGSEKQLYLLAKGLKKIKYNVSIIVLSSTSDPYGNMLKEIGVNVVCFKRRLPYFDIFRMARIRKKLIEENINIIYSYSLTANFYSFFSTFFLKNIIFISGSRNIEIDRSRLLKFLDDIIIRKSKALITNSKSNLDYLKGISYKPNSINGFVIKNGIDITPQKNKNRKNLKQKITIGTVALFKKQKNYSLFIDLCKSISLKYDKINFISIGYGPEFEKMELYAKENNLDEKLKFLGNNMDAGKIMEKNFDIFILTSYKEGLPNVVMEAMSFGIPVVSTNVGGVKELIEHKKTGFLVPSNDLEGLVYYCSQLINSPTLRHQIGNAAIGFIKDQFSSGKMVNEFEAVFDKLFSHKD